MKVGTKQLPEGAEEGRTVVESPWRRRREVRRLQLSTESKVEDGGR
jgi:hypothetical protein